MNQGQQISRVVFAAISSMQTLKYANKKTVRVATDIACDQLGIILEPEDLNTAYDMAISGWNEVCKLRISKCH